LTSKKRARTPKLEYAEVNLFSDHARLRRQPTRLQLRTFQTGRSYSSRLPHLSHGDDAVIENEIRSALTIFADNKQAEPNGKDAPQADAFRQRVKSRFRA
jgi:hypothetical protein